MYVDSFFRPILHFVGNCCRIWCSICTIKRYNSFLGLILVSTKGSRPDTKGTNRNKQIFKFHRSNHNFSTKNKSHKFDELYYLIAQIEKRTTNPNSVQGKNGKSI